VNRDVVAGVEAEIHGTGEGPWGVQWSMRATKRKRTVVGLATAVVAIIGVVFTGGAAQASCFRPPDVEADLESSDLVFVGLATDLATENRWVMVRIEERWKGDPGGDRAEVRAGPGGGTGGQAATSIDRTYVAGERYLVFASDLSRRPGAGVDFCAGARWVDSACSATRPYESSLDRFRPAANAGPVSYESGGSVATAVILGAVVILAAGAMVAAALRRLSRAA